MIEGKIDLSGEFITASMFARSEDKKQR